MDDKHIRTLRGLSKFFAGLIAADLIFGLWLGSTQYISVLWGISITGPVLDLWLVMDAILFLLLIHFGWHMRMPAAQGKRLVLIIAGCVLMFVAAMHVLRIIYNVPIEIGTVMIPLWLSVIGAIAASVIGYMCFRFSARR